MATYYFGLNKGQRQEQVVVNTVSNGTDVELAVNGTNVTSQQDALMALENIENFLTQYKFPPA